MLSLAQFWSMRHRLRSLVLLFWVYSFVSRAVGAFSQIYIYKMFDSVQLNIVAAMASFTGIMIGFCVYGVIAAQYRLNAKHGFLLSFLFTALGLILLALAGDVQQACGAVTVRGIGAGLFWLTIHTYELMESRDHERDIYSTFLSAGDQILTLASPAFATLLIWLSHNLGLGEFTLLFLVTPPIFLLGLPSLGALKDYRPEPIARHDLVHFVADRRNQAAQVYLLGGAASHILPNALIPLASITVLGSALNVGGFNTVFAFAGALALLVVGSRRRPENRLAILGLSSIALDLAEPHARLLADACHAHRVYHRHEHHAAGDARLAARHRPQDHGRHGPRRERFLPRHDPARRCLVGLAHGGGGTASGLRGRRGDGPRGDFAGHVYDRGGHRRDLRRRVAPHRVETLNPCRQTGCVTPN